MLFANCNDLYGYVGVVPRVPTPDRGDRGGIAPTIITHKTYSRVGRNRVFLRKSCAVVSRLGKKPGFFGFDA